MSGKITDLEAKRRELEQIKRIKNSQFTSAGSLILNFLKLPEDGQFYLAVSYQLEDNLSDEELQQIKNLLKNSLLKSLDEVFKQYKT